jgi:transcriptional regulator with XRE-family HTH domain
VRSFRIPESERQAAPHSENEYFPHCALSINALAREHIHRRKSQNGMCCGPLRFILGALQQPSRYALGDAQQMAVNPGHQLRRLRERLGMTLRDVEAASAAIAAKYENPNYLVSLSRLCEIESKDTLPSIYRLYSLAAVYRRDISEIFSYYGVHSENLLEDVHFSPAHNTHLTTRKPAAQMRVPVQLDPSFNISHTTNVGRMIAQWGSVPAEFLARLSESDYTFGYIGYEDFTMYPLLMPGSFVQVDEGRRKIVEGNWRSEYERPIYFVEMREGFACCWCSLDSGNLVLEPHPLSGCKVRVRRHQVEAEVIGQVVGVAMRLSTPWSHEKPAEVTALCHKC